MVMTVKRVEIEYQEPYSVPNRGPLPRIEKEEKFAKNRFDTVYIRRGWRKADENWNKGLKWYERLHNHATMNSVRRNHYCKRPYEPKDELDFVMEAAYCPQKELFSEKTDPYLHIETVLGEKLEARKKKMRELKQNLNDYISGLMLQSKKPMKYNPPEPEDEEPWRVLKNRILIFPDKHVPRSHPLVYSNGGVSRRGNIYNVKLGIPADHSSHSNPGYSRTPSGAFYCI